MRTLETAHDTCGDYRKRDFGDGMDAAPTHEQLTRMVAKLEATIRELEEQNVVLRRSAVDFGALAERLKLGSPLSARLVARVLENQSLAGPRSRRRSRCPTPAS